MNMKNEYENTDTHWVSLFVKANKVIYFDTFGLEDIPEEINKLIKKLKQVYLEYKRTIQLCADIFV